MHKRAPWSICTAGTTGQKYVATSGPDQAEGTYFYFVTVEEVGTLDPRVIVER